ncbi:hypothetical protein KSP40_PGU007016 [Platanthera guangdongensis]|uniref:SEC63 domain-containing protein n=1 Tax=Platanthera guangdongensis TaxID=2320717 RepID=A0ABR2MMD0_9ASPA
MASLSSSPAPISPAYPSVGRLSDSPCFPQYTASLNCLEVNQQDKSKCQLLFDDYKECKKKEVVKQYLSYFPSISLSANISPITRTVLKVDVIITPDFVWKDRFHGASERWWFSVEKWSREYHMQLFVIEHSF